ncbi:hypothetical protein P4U99_09910 [Brevibacillus agri]|uniref:hypothetical protein n=1 Tax=Brevibacillus agri TaxID=51101 RepID=UPI000A6CAC33|nr:hypothetical protein [Brevibacillus agri]MBY0053501.1 hypothetical protein [Brevibacillus agri]MCG5251506.1 hypothetical protein [Brevibacillus agri]MED1643502.1 hypothetical protein [Brevibacillus agri]MED1653591.1 hypothetical protein [Brevibacillus agri]MED1685168.1 hypothetical protein [Brevibacillus agri]
MTGVIITVAAIGVFLLSGYFMTKWEKAVFPGNQQNGSAPDPPKHSDKNGRQ